MVSGNDCHYGGEEKHDPMIEALHRILLEEEGPKSLSRRDDGDRQRGTSTRYQGPASRPVPPSGEGYFPSETADSPRRKGRRNSISKRAAKQGQASVPGQLPTFPADGSRRSDSRQNRRSSIGKEGCGKHVEAPTHPPVSLDDLASLETGAGEVPRRRKTRRSSIGACQSNQGHEYPPSPEVSSVSRTKDDHTRRRQVRRSSIGAPNQESRPSHQILPDKASGLSVVSDYDRYYGDDTRRQFFDEEDPTTMSRSDDGASQAGRSAKCQVHPSQHVPSSSEKNVPFAMDDSSRRKARQTSILKRVSKQEQESTHGQDRLMAQQGETSQSVTSPRRKTVSSATGDSPQCKGGRNSISKRATEQDQTIQQCQVESLITSTTDDRPCSVPRQGRRSSIGKSVANQEHAYVHLPVSTGNSLSGEVPRRRQARRSSIGACTARRPSISDGPGKASSAPELGERAHERRSSLVNRIHPPPSIMPPPGGICMTSSRNRFDATKQLMMTAAMSQRARPKRRSSITSLSPGLTEGQTSQRMPRRSSPTRSVRSYLVNSMRTPAPGFIDFTQ